MGFCGNEPMGTGDPLGLAGYFFGGTGNSLDPKGISNVEMLYRAWEEKSNGSKYYVPGVFSGYAPDGRRYGTVSRALRLLRMPLEGAAGKSTDARVDQMLTYLDQELAAGDAEVNVFGFSRGALSAVEFLNRIQDRIEGGNALYHCIRVKVVIMWDIVKTTAYDYHSELPKQMSFAYQPLHFIALDEQRSQFFDEEVLNVEGALQIGYRGVHADVGNGYKSSAFGWLSRNDAVMASQSVGLRFSSAQLSKYAPVVNWSAVPTENDKGYYNGSETRTFPSDMYLHWSVDMFGVHSKPANDVSGLKGMSREVWLRWQGGL